MKITIQTMVTPYTHQDMDTVIKIAEAALKRGHEVRIFLFADAIVAANKKIKPMRIDRKIPELLEKLIEKGVRIDICGLCMEYRGLTEDSIIKGAKPSGLPELAELIYTSDRFVNLMA